MELKESNIETIYGDGPFSPYDMYTYECKPGYKNTAFMIVCGLDGNWSSQPGCTEG